MLWHSKTCRQVFLKGESYKSIEKKEEGGWFVVVMRDSNKLEHAHTKMKV